MNPNDPPRIGNLRGFSMNEGKMSAIFDTGGCEGSIVFTRPGTDAGMVAFGLRELACTIEAYFTRLPEHEARRRLGELIEQGPTPITTETGIVIPR